MDALASGSDLSVLWLPPDSNLDLDHRRQSLGTEERYTDLNAGNYGHLTWANDPPSNLTSLEDVIDMGYAGPSIKIRDVMDTTSGPFCYSYI